MRLLEHRVSLVVQAVKNLPAMQETQVRSLGGNENHFTKEEQKLTSVLYKILQPQAIYPTTHSNSIRASLIRYLEEPPDLCEMRKLRAGQ